MRHWEYLTFPIQYDKKAKDWAVKHTDRPPLAGLSNVLEHFGSEGWDLVSLQLERSQFYPGFGSWHIEPESYRATFKRPVGD